MDNTIDRSRSTTSENLQCMLLDILTASSSLHTSGNFLPKQLEMIRWPICPDRICLLCQEPAERQKRQRKMPIVLLRGLGGLGGSFEYGGFSTSQIKWLCEICMYASTSATLPVFKLKPSPASCFDFHSLLRHPKYRVWTQPCRPFANSYPWRNGRWKGVSTSTRDWLKHYRASKLWSA